MNFASYRSAAFAVALLALGSRPALAQSVAPVATPVVVETLGAAASVDVHAYFQPFDDAESAALAELAKAQKTVHIAHYNIRNSKFYDALVALKARGVEVTIATDAKEAAEPYNTLTAQFKTAGFDVLAYQPPTSQYAIMHLKACVIDGATVMTGSYNWNNTAQLSNDENMLVIHDATVAAEYERYIACIWSNTITTWQPQIAAGSPIEVHFSPADHPGSHLENLINAAKTRVTCAIFAFTDKYVEAALKNAVKRGVVVELVWEQKEIFNSTYPGDLMNAGVHVILGANTASAYSAMHHKFAVVDDAVFTGACNWTVTAFLDSCEDDVIIRDAQLAAAYRHEWKALVKRYDSTNYDPTLFGIETPTSHVQFVADQPRTQLGDRVFVVGNQPQLGNWDPTQAVELFTSDDVFPDWSASVELPAGLSVEYKYVTLSPDGTVSWEDGDNRTFTVDPAGTDEARQETYRFPASAGPDPGVVTTAPSGGN